MKLLIRISIALLVCALIASGGQRRSRRQSPTRNRPPAIDYSKFSHATKKHQQKCDSCHRIPTSNWKKASEFPDVADYPGHEACVSCHRSQFFRSAKPVICSVCHSKVSPRDDARFDFRKRSQPGEFATEFPHDKHQDVIARLLDRLFQRPQFVRARFNSEDDKTKHYNNCEICHAPLNGMPATPRAGWIDAFIPNPDSFKASPSGHDACFSCHWKSQQPVNENCGGCHKLARAPIAVASLQRISMKFRHAREQHVAECTTCHINITKSATLRGLKPDVPITACTECHNKDGLRLDLSKELVALDKNRDFICTYCHTSDVGRLDPPAGHYLIADRPPIKRKDMK